MSEPASISAGIAERYATAVFGLAKDEKALTALEADVDALEAALNESADLRAMVTSPIYTRAEQGQATHALSTKMGLTRLVANTLRLMAEKRRLFVLPQLVRSLRDRIADEKGEVTADVATATELTKTQLSKLAKTLKEKVGKDVNIKTTVDESLIGGLVVKVGSKMIDTSVKAKLANLQNAMKEVG